VLGQYLACDKVGRKAALFLTVWVRDGFLARHLATTAKGVGKQLNPEIDAFAS
jgi:hypothetical protein